MATFLFSLGPDHTGRAIARVFRPGFLEKVQRTSVVSHYGIRTLLYGTLLPGPDIGEREAGRLRLVQESGFEVGIHCWDHVRWQDRLMQRDDAWALREMAKAAERFREVFGKPPRVHGAAGWQFHEGVARAESALGITLASDTRGSCPFQPIGPNGADIGPVQLPTTLPTLDELIGRDGWTEANVHQSMLARTRELVTDQVFTLHAELEGMQFAGVLQHMFEGWQRQGHTLVSLSKLMDGIDRRALPRRRIVQGNVPGRSGLLAIQGGV
ncbi:polysaccharide deacetylase family protein [Variovorax sp. RT4R15]|uniref:polysaccharide deacetylase family protein n=1 Tax=Variovorax sp. RT4R15 TaxID=3443737 RepID=UPI003F488725